jgi:lysozyme
MALIAAVGGCCAALLLGEPSEPGSVGITERFEGMILHGYLDPIGIPTKCAGDTYDVKVGKRYTLAECKASLENGLLKHAKPVLACAPYLKDKPFALASSIDHNYNFGTFCNTSMNIAFKAGDYITGCKRFNEAANGKPQWVYVKDGKGGYKTLPGLVKRAAARRELCERQLKQTDIK